jgi:hypothetical protein
MDQPSFSAASLPGTSGDITIDQLPGLYLQNQSIANVTLYNPAFQHLQQNENQLSQSSEAINASYEDVDQKPDLAKLSKGKPTCIPIVGYGKILSIFVAFGEIMSSTMVSNLRLR